MTSSTGGFFGRTFLVALAGLVAGLAVTALLLGLALSAEDVRSRSAGEDAASEARADLGRVLVVALAAGLVAGAAAAGAAARGLARSLARTRRFAEAVGRESDRPDPPATTIPGLAALNARLDEIAAAVAGQIHSGARGQMGLRIILAGMVEGVIAVDADGRVIMINESASRMLGLSDNADGRDLGEIETDTALGPLMDRCLASGRTIVEELAIERRQGKLVFDLTIAPLRDAGTRPIGAVAVLHDVTTLRLAHKMRRDFVTNVSHEIKTPLTAIRGAATTLLDAPGMDDETRRKFLKNIERNSARLEQLIMDVLELSRIQQGGAQLDYEDVDLAQLVKGVVSRMSQTAVDRGIELSCACGPAKLKADRRALTSIVENLLSNAIRYTPRGGRIDVSLTEERAEVTLRVTDTGIGIPKELQERIFERFFRVDRARSRSDGGTGLGLAIVKNYVLNHRGRVAVTSEPGRGSTFTVTMPTDGRPGDEITRNGA